MARNRTFDDFDPTAVWSRSDDADFVQVSLPGFKREEIRVLVDNHGRLRTSGQRFIAGNKWRRFHKDFEIPANCNSDGIRARFENERLTITLPKKTTSPPMAPVAPPPRRPAVTAPAAPAVARPTAPPPPTVPAVPEPAARPTAPPPTVPVAPLVPAPSVKKPAAEPRPSMPRKPYPYTPAPPPEVEPPATAKPPQAPPLAAVQRPKEEEEQAAREAAGKMTEDDRKQETAAQGKAMEQQQKEATPPPPPADGTAMANLIQPRPASASRGLVVNVAVAVVVLLGITVYVWHSLRNAAGEHGLGHLGAGSGSYGDEM